MRGIFTRDERAVVLFLAASLAIGSLVLVARRVGLVPEPRSQDRSAAAECQAVDGEGQPGGPIDVNAATAAELTALPGIGPVRAASIVRLRTDRGGFGSVDDLLDVKGIGPVTLERLRPLAVAGDRAGGSGGESASLPDSVARGSVTPE